ncbi:MAG: hypothetical protein RL171_1459, partial [Pseudomonadota bacterium]
FFAVAIIFSLFTCQRALRACIFIHKAIHVVASHLYALQQHEQGKHTRQFSSSAKSVMHASFYNHLKLQISNSHLSIFNPKKAHRLIDIQSHGFQKSYALSSSQSFHSSRGMGSLRSGTASPNQSVPHGGSQYSASNL